MFWDLWAGIRNARLEFLRAEFCPQFNEIAISDNEGGWLAFFCPWKPELGSAARRSIRSSVSMRRPARAGCKDAPTPPPDVARSRSHRGAAGRLGGGTNCWCGTAAARSSPRKAGVQPGLNVWAYDVPRAACASSGAPKRWLAADVTTFASIYMELRPARLRGGFLRVCHLHFDLDGRRAGSTPCLGDRKPRSGSVHRRWGSGRCFQG